MKYFINLKFIERGSEYPMDLISIGIVSEDWREYYAINRECEFSNANPWIRGNVLDALPQRPRYPFDYSQSKPKNEGWRTREEIKKEILEFVGDKETPEFWGEWCFYGWVVFGQLFGKIEDFPKNYPVIPNDIIQTCVNELGLKIEDLPISLEKTGNFHALLGARTVRARYQFLMAVRERSNYYAYDIP